MPDNPTESIPIACDPSVFSKDELDAHIALSLDVIFRWPKRVDELADGYLFTYEGNEELFLQVARFVAAEHRCCPWESFTLEMEPFAATSNGTLRLRYEGGPEGKPAIAEAFQQLASAANDSSVQQRLREALANFGTITSANQRAFYEKVAGEPDATCVRERR